MPYKLINKIKNLLSTIKRGVNTLLREALRKTDYQRWSNKESLSQSWDTRTKQIAALIKPGASVIKFGAGRLILKTFLPENCSYTPSDLVDRGYGTIICYLNSKALQQFKTYDVAVFSGVLEYINDIPRLIFYLSRCVNVIIASYAVIEENKSNRSGQGWVNDYNSKQFINIFENAGFRCDYTEEWQSQVIYKFIRKQPKDVAPLRIKLHDSRE